MADFKFSLSSVEKYKETIFDETKNKYSEALAAVTRQNELIDSITGKIATAYAELDEKNKEGISILEYQGYRRYLKVLENSLKEEKEKLISLQRLEKRRQTEMIFAKKEVKALEVIKEKRYEEHQKEQLKKERQQIDEFVARSITMNEITGMGH